MCSKIEFLVLLVQNLAKTTAIHAVTLVATIHVTDQPSNIATRGTTGIAPILAHTITVSTAVLTNVGAIQVVQPSTTTPEQTCVF